MIYSQKYHFYKFPGGGIEGNETHSGTLAREIKEETGMILIPDSLKEFGEVVKIQKSDENGENTIHIQQSFYYLCKVEKEIGEQNLDEKEKDSEFVLKFVPIEEQYGSTVLLKATILSKNKWPSEKDEFWK